MLNSIPNSVVEDQSEASIQVTWSLSTNQKPLRCLTLTLLGSRVSLSKMSSSVRWYLESEKVSTEHLEASSWSRRHYRSIILNKTSGGCPNIQMRPDNDPVYQSWMNIWYQENRPRRRDKVWGILIINGSTRSETGETSDDADTQEDIRHPLILLDHTSLVEFDASIATLWYQEPGHYMITLVRMSNDHNRNIFTNVSKSG